jgi:hypothetical protein
LFYLAIIKYMYHRFAVFFEYKNGTESTFQASYYRILKKFFAIRKTVLALPKTFFGNVLCEFFSVNVLCEFFSKMLSFCSLAMFTDPF